MEEFESIGLNSLTVQTSESLHYHQTVWLFQWLFNPIWDNFDHMKEISKLAATVSRIDLMLLGVKKSTHRVYYCVNVLEMAFLWPISKVNDKKQTLRKNLKRKYHTGKIRLKVCVLRSFQQLVMPLSNSWAYL